ncbi:MAG: pyridoxamine 5'-phosphate oxidase family protein [Cyclobacteriaceae bacterium]
MAKNFGSLAFTDEVKLLQEKYGSRKHYERMQMRTVIDGLTDFEVEFISHRDSFYMASLGENGYPYIQHRGGPKGFVKVIDSKTIGFMDFSGNRQFITMGNLATHNKVSLIMMDYPARARLKIYAKAEIIELNDRQDLFNMLNLNDDYPAKPERMLLLHIEAYDWNCPQHISPRYTIQELEEAGVSGGLKELKKK